MLQVPMVPLDKPGRDSEQCGSKRPISLIPVLSKALEAVVLHRLFRQYEARLSPGQYAYRRERGTEMHILGLSDFVRKSRDAGKYVYMASIDVAAAFDNVSHDRLMETSESLGTDSYVCRYVITWLRSRVFKLRLRTSTGCCLSSWRRITKGVPQGGVLYLFCGCST